MKGEGRPLGEIYLGPDYIRRHGEDLSYMAVHGLLHLLGHDHTEKGERLRMERKERQIMKLSFSRGERSQTTFQIPKRTR